jgi:hypothetical protein
VLVTENQLDEWVRGNARDAQGTIVELVWRLVAAASPRPKERRFPLGDSIGQPGPDGVLDIDFPREPFVPEGRSFWEIGTGVDAGRKATSDYRELVAAAPAPIRLESVFIFVTPLSGRRDWPNTWKADSQGTWLEERRKRKDWRDVRVIDGTRLVDWIHHFPSVELWLAKKLGIAVQEIETPEQRWNILQTIGEPPPLTPRIFLTNREPAGTKLKEVFAGTQVQLRLDTHFPDQVVDFVCAYVANMDEDSRIDALGRCLVVSGVDAWNEIASRTDRHVVVADFDLDDAGTSGTRLLEKARRAGHAVIFGGRPGGVPHANRESIPNPKTHQIKEALQDAGYGEERARILSQKSGGHLGSLLRCLQNLSVSPHWAEETAAGELAIAELLGAWNDSSEADRAVIEGLSGNAYGEWIGKMREVALRPGTPLTQRDGIWKVVARYEGWYALGPKLFDEHLTRLRTAAVSVLRERDPRFDLPSEERYAAQVHGKVLAHSQLLRNGLAESLALLGSHPRALTSCSFGRAELTAALSVRDILASADWLLWASLNDLLPLLAEAAPGEFLDAAERALLDTPSPFAALFAQESSGIMGANYMTGLLWALETLAWDAEQLTRVVMILGELAGKDPGGNWGNRPSNSLTTILLPWLPQTCASPERRAAAVATLLAELPSVAWRLLLDLLPRSHSSSFESRKPAWREIIPDDWTKGVTHRQYWDQIALYAEMAIKAAKADLSRLVDLIERLDDLRGSAGEQLLAYLESASVASLPESDRLPLWVALSDLVAKHRRFSDADWALPPATVDRLAMVAQRLAPNSPALSHQRLFSERDFDLYTSDESYDDQQVRLDTQRQVAVQEVFATGGVQPTLEFARAVQSPWRVGIAFGIGVSGDTGQVILPGLLETTDKSLAQFTGGFVWGRFRAQGWPWVDGIDTSRWTPAQTGQFLAYLPFTPETWQRAARLLGALESQYWTKTSANSYEPTSGLELAVDRLIEHGRPHAAIRCLQVMRYRKQPFDSVRAVRALLAAVGSSGTASATDGHEIAEVIKTLQNDPRTNAEDLFRVEWAYLPLLDGHRGAFPTLLERRLADDPHFFCEVIRLVFKSRNAADASDKPTEQAKSVAANAYRLLSHWRTPPGSRQDGTYDGEALGIWLNEVSRICIETGHVEVAMTIVGHVLSHVAADPEGLWIHRSAATALNARDAEDMRDGFVTELFNRRGVHGFSAGQEEKELAARFRSQAEAVESNGFHRLAVTMRKLATSYDRDAEREASRDPFEE